MIYKVKNVDTANSSLKEGRTLQDLVLVTSYNKNKYKLKQLRSRGREFSV